MKCVTSLSAFTCEHGGDCVLTGPQTHVCDCHTGFTGTYCEQGNISIIIEFATAFLILTPITEENCCVEKNIWAT